MDGAQICYLPAVELASLIARREISPVEATRAVLERIDAWEPHINAFITVAGDQAMDAARAAEDAVMRGDDLGPIHGVPYSVKDLLNTAGARTTFGSYAFETNVPDADCVAVARLRAELR